MKKYMIYGMMLALGMGMASCNEDFAEAPIPVPEGGRVGTGAWDNPMTAWQALIGSVNNNLIDTISIFDIRQSGESYQLTDSYVEQKKNPWVTGYIVGYVNTNVSNTISEASAALVVDDENPCSVATNMLIAVRPDSITWEDCATVQLPSGAARSALNLSDHPENLGKLVTVKGETGSKYCGAYGVRSVSDYNWGDQGIQEEPSGSLEPLPYLWEPFEKSDKISYYTSQGWKNVSVAGGLDGWYIREFNGQNYITVSAYLGNANGGPYENWLIAPPVDLDKCNTKTLRFRTQAAYQAENSILEVYALTTTSMEPKLVASIASAPSSGYSSWVDSGEIDLSAFSGVVYIGWRYYSAAGGNNGSTTYCVDNVNIGGAPEVTEPAPGDNSIYSGLNQSDTSIDWTFDIVKMSDRMSYVWSWAEHNDAHYLNGSGYVGGTAYESLAYAISPTIDLSKVSKASVVFEHAARFQTTLKELCGFCVREEGTSAWTEISIPKWPAAGGWTFVSSGDIDISSFAGKKVQIAFKYGSSTQGADTWEIRNVKVTGE